MTMQDGDTGPTSYRNWRAHTDGKPLHDRAEIPIYSDIEFSLPPLEGMGPYRLQHAFPVELSDPALVLFVDSYLDPSDSPRMDKTETAGYTGTLLGDEVAALLSLSLGKRFMAGAPTRSLSPVNKDEWIIMGDRSRPQFLRSTATRIFGRRGAILPRACERIEVNAELLTVYPKVSAQGATALVRAARLYRDALWIAESEPEISWLLLVSALEVAAVHQQAELPAIDILRLSKAKLAKRLDEVDPALAEEVAASLSRELRAMKRFFAFMQRFMPPPPALRPPHGWALLDWDGEPMKKALEQVYKLRSLALHEGIPFPPPMSQQPYSDNDWPAPSERVLGLAAGSTGGTWMSEDMPMLLHTFEYIARGALLRWWSTIAA
jgi:hypothetical protein